MKRHLGARGCGGLIHASRALACVPALLMMLMSLSCANTADQAQGGRGGPEVLEIPSGNFTAAWRAQVPLGQAQPRAIHVNEDRVLVYTTDNKCIFVNRASGHIVSIIQAAKPTDILYSPCTLPDRVVFPSTSELSVCDRNGKLLHRIKLRYNGSSGASGDGRMVFLGADHPNGGRVIAMDTRPQPYEVSPAWELMTHGQVSAAPAVFQGLVFAGSRDGGVYALRGENRDNIWPGLDIGYYKTDGEILADLQTDKDGVYVASMDSKLYCLDINTGRVRWTYYAGRPLRQDSSPVPTANFVFLYVPQLGIVALEKTGVEVRKPKWNLASGRQFLSTDEKYVYVRGSDNSIMGVEKSSGVSKFASRRNDFRFFAINNTGKDSNIYACTSGGMLYSISAVLKPGTVGEWVFSPNENAAGAAEAVAAK